MLRGGVPGDSTAHQVDGWDYLSHHPGCWEVLSKLWLTPFVKQTNKNPTSPVLQITALEEGKGGGGRGEEEKKKQEQIESSYRKQSEFMAYGRGHCQCMIFSVVFVCVRLQYKTYFTCELQ